MSLLSRSNPAFYSHQYLADAVQQGQNKLVTDNNGVNLVIESANSVPTGQSQLVVTAPGLNAEKLSSVLHQLPGTVGQSGLRLWANPHLPGQQIVAKTWLAKDFADRLKLELESLCTALQVELMIIDSIPSFAEPGLLVMDMDSTVIAVECIDEIARLAGVGEQVSQVTELAMQGELAFADSLINRVACLASADVAILQQVRDALPLMPGVVNLVNVLKQHDWKLAIASGGFTYFADYLKQRLGLDYAISNVLEIEDNKLTGRVCGNIVDAQIKADTVDKLTGEFCISPRQTIAMGDGANDLVMMDRAGLGVAAHAKPIVRQQADVAIRFGGLDTLLALISD